MKIFSGLLPRFSSNFITFHQMLLHWTQLSSRMSTPIHETLYIEKALATKGAHLHLKLAVLGKIVFKSILNLPTNTKYFRKMYFKYIVKYIKKYISNKKYKNTFFGKCFKYKIHFIFIQTFGRQSLSNENLVWSSQRFLRYRY